jgi:hypothetical protein
MDASRTDVETRTNAPQEAGLSTERRAMDIVRAEDEARG